MMNASAVAILALLLVSCGSPEPRSEQPTVEILNTSGDGLAPLSLLQVPDEYGDCASCARIVRQMAWSLEHEPDAWTTNGFYVIRKDGPAIWVASGVNFIRIGPKKTEVAMEPLQEAERELLWRAHNQWVYDSVERVGR